MKHIAFCMEDQDRINEIAPPSLRGRPIDIDPGRLGMWDAHPGERDGYWQVSDFCAEADRRKAPLFNDDRSEYLMMSRHLKFQDDVEHRRGTQYADFAGSLLIKAFDRKCDERTSIPMYSGAVKQNHPWYYSDEGRRDMLGSGMMWKARFHIAGKQSTEYLLSPLLFKDLRVYRICDPFIISQRRRRRARRLNEYKAIRSAVASRAFADFQRLRVNEDLAESLLVGLENEDFHRLALGRIARGDIWWLWKDATGWRVHSNLTVLLSELRASLFFDGYTDGLFEVDVKNCQFLLLAILARQTGADGGDNRFLRSCESGSIYEEIRDHVNALEGRKKAVDREKAKRLTIAWLFGEIDKWPSVIDGFFAKHHPRILSMVREAKEPRSGERDRYKSLAVSLQRLESQLMIDGVLRRVQTELKHCPAATIHDSLLCVPDASEKIRDLIVSEFEKHGATPTVAIKQAGSGH